MEPTDNWDESFKYTFIFEHRDGTDTFTAKSDSFILDHVLYNFMQFLYDEHVGFVNPVTFTIHDDKGGKEVTCKPPSVE